MNIDELFKSAYALLDEGAALLCAHVHVANNDTIKRHIKAVDAWRAQYRAAKEAPAPASEVAPPGFRIVGRSGPGVPVPRVGWIRVARLSDGTPTDRDEPRTVDSGYDISERLWKLGCYDILEPIPAPAPEPSAPPKCEPWCGGELCPGTGSEFCKCLDVDRYFCAKACQAAEQPIRPQPPVPAHEAWTLRRMMNGWKEHAEQVADGLASRFGQPSAPPAGVPVCKVGCGRFVDRGHEYCSDACAEALRPLNPPTSDPVTARSVPPGPVPMDPPVAPASEPAVRPLSERIGARFVDEVAALEAEFAEEKAAHDMTRDAVKVAVDCENAARAEVEQLRAMALHHQTDAITVHAQATARVRSMREAAAKAMEDRYGEDCDSARIIRALPLDTGPAPAPMAPCYYGGHWCEHKRTQDLGTAPVCLDCGKQQGATGEVLAGSPGWTGQAIAPLLRPTQDAIDQADAIKAAIAAANNRAADAFARWDNGDINTSAEEFEAWLRSGEDAPGAVGK